MGKSTRTPAPPKQDAFAFKPEYNDVLQQKPQVAATQDQSFAFKPEYNEEVKKKVGGSVTSNTPSVSASGSSGTTSNPASTSPSDFINQDIDNNSLNVFGQFAKTVEGFTHKIPTVNSDESAKKTKEAVFSSSEALTMYNTDRIAKLRKEVNDIGARQGGLVEYFQPDPIAAPTVTSQRIKDPIEYEALEKQKKEKEQYINKLKGNVADVATNLIVSQTDFKALNPQSLGRSIVKVADPELESQFQVAETGGLTLPGIKTGELSKLGINAAKNYLINNPTVPDRDNALAYVNKLEQTFENDNPELTALNVREKLGSYFYKKGNSGFFGWGDQNLEDAINDPETGLTPGEKKIAKEYVLPIEKKIIGTDIPTSGFFRSAAKALESSVVNTGKTISDITGVRSESDQARDFLNQEAETRFRRVGENPSGLAQLGYLKNKEKNGKLTEAETIQKKDLEKYVDVRNNWSRFKDGVGDLTGQVAWMAIGTKGIGAAGELLAGASKAGGILSGLTTGTLGTALSNETVGLFVSSYLNSYDNYKTQSIGLIPGVGKEAERDAYAKTMAAVEGLSERIFPDTKILGAFTKKVAPTIQDITERFINKEITQQVAKEEMQTALSKYLKPFGKEFAKSTLQESSEEAVTDLADGMAQSIYGGQPFDIAKTGQQALNTFLTTALYSPLVAGMAAHGAYRNQKSQNAFLKSSIVNMAANPAEYLKSVEDLQLNGTITQSEANDKIKLIKSANSYLKEMAASRPVSVKVETDGQAQEQEKPFDFPETSSYLLHRLNEGILTEKIEKTTDPILRSQLEKQLKRSVEIRKGIFDGSIAVTPNIQEVTDNPEQAQELGIADVNQVNPDDLVGTNLQQRLNELAPVEGEVKLDEATTKDATKFVNELVDEGLIQGAMSEVAKKDPIAFLKMVSDQANNVTETGEKNKTDNPEQAARDQFTDSVVDYAKEIFPITNQTGERVEEKLGDDSLQAIEGVPEAYARVGVHKSERGYHAWVETEVPGIKMSKGIGATSYDTYDEARKAGETEVREKYQSEQKGIKEKGADLANRLRQLKSKKDVVQANLFGIPLAIYDGAIETVATAIEKGAELADAINEAVQSLKGTKDFDESNFRKHIEDFAAGEKPRIKVQLTDEDYKTQQPNSQTINTDQNAKSNDQKGSGQESQTKSAPEKQSSQRNDEGQKVENKGVEPAVAEATDEAPISEPTKEPERDKRRFSQQVLGDEDILPEVKKGIQAKIDYLVQTNAMSVAEAEQVIKDIGEEEAYNQVVNGDLKPAVRVVVGQALIKKFNDLAVKATTEEDKNYYIDKTIDIANFVSEKLGTEAGQMIQAFSLYSRLSPEAQLRSVTKEVKKQAAKKKEKSKKNVDKIGDQLKKANEEAVDELEKRPIVKEAVKNTDSRIVKKAKDKIANAKSKREKILKKYKDSKGKSLYSTVGLTTEGIEFVGDLVKTYLDEGIANLTIIADNVLTHLKEVSQKEPTPEVIKGVNEIVADKLYGVQNKKLAEGLREIESSVGKALDKYGLVPDEVKNDLIESISKKSLLSGNELDLFKSEVSAEIDKIIERKKVSPKEKTEQQKTTEGLRKLESEVGKIIRKHYTITEEQKTSLTDKFVNELGLEKDEAASLAAEIQTEFEKIATRKKQAILEKEKARFDRIQNQLQGAKKVEKKTLEGEIIKLSNLGAFNNEELLNLIANKLGTGSLTPEQGKEIERLAKAIEKAPEGGPKQKATEDLLRYRADIKGASWGEVIQAVWYANILSGYGTHIKNIVSTFINGAAFAAAEAAREPRAIPYILMGAAKGLARRGIPEAWHTVKTGETPIHVSKVETPDVLERKNFIGGYWNPYNWLKFVGRLMKAEDVLQFQALKESRAAQLAYREAARLGHTNPFSRQTWDKVNELLLNTKERHDEALQQAKDEGLTDKSETKRRVYELMEMSRPIQMTEDAYGFAAKGTFNHASEGTLGAITNAVATLLDVQVGGVRPVRFVVPFTRIITNVANNLMDFSPVGFVRAARGVRGFESFEKSRFTKDAYHVMTKEERAQTVAKASLGIALTMGLYALTKIKGDDDEPLIEITGGGTGNIKKDIQLKQSGWQPYSIKIGDKYYSYALTPLMLNLSFIGDVNDHDKYAKNADDEDIIDKATLALYLRVKMISDMTWIGSTGTLMSALSSDDPKALERGVSGTLKNAAKGFIVPNAYSQIAQKTQQIFDMPQKQTNGLLQELYQDIPIARNTLNDKINALGDPVIRDKDILVSRETKDPVWKFLLDKKAWVAPVSKNSLIIYDDKTKQDRPVTDDEYYKFSKLRGGKLKDGIANIIQNGALTTENGTVTTNEDLATGSKPASSLTSAEMQKLIRAIATKATKESKLQMLDPEN